MPMYISASLTFCLTGASPPPPALPVGVKLRGALPLIGAWELCLLTTGVPGRVVRVGTAAVAGVKGVATVAAGPVGAGGGPSAGRHCGFVPVVDGAFVAGCDAGTGVTVA